MSRAPWRQRSAGSGLRDQVLTLIAYPYELLLSRPSIAAGRRLDHQAGGEIAARLGDLYDYIVRRLTHANLHGDDAALAECAKLVATLQDGWNGIAAQVSAVGA